ncbi:MAG TPA: VOC family protein [Capsulimonadaceae bacterium]|nr:VOC family protein [Capsulimonadaceae bacterium]
MKANTYLYFNGDCEAAFKFYEQALGAKVLVLMPYAGTPAEAHGPAEWKNKIIHGRLQLGDTVFYGSDGTPDNTSQPGGFSICLHGETPEDAERIYNALKEGGNVIMPIEETFFAHRFAMLKDKFGTPWMVICEKQM